MKKLSLLIPGALIITFLIAQCLTLGKTERMIRIDPVTPIDGYQVMVLLSRNNFNYKAAQQDGADVRVFDTERQPLNFWIENWNPHGISIIWVKIPTAGTDKVFITSGNADETPGSDGTKVFDPLTWDTFKSDWLYSGIIPGMVSGWEYPLTEFDRDVKDWTPVTIDTNYVDECEHSRWFVRKEVFIARGEITYSGEADDDVVWTLIRADELYWKTGGKEFDSDGKNAGTYSGTINLEEPFGHFIWAGRGQEGEGQAKLTITSIDSGIEYLYTRKIVRPAAFIDKEVEVDEEVEVILPDEGMEESLDGGTEEIIGG